MASLPHEGVVAWRALVAKTLRDKPFDSLTHHTVDGLAIVPLYDAATSARVFPPRPAAADRPWDIRTLIDHPDPARANAEALRDLEGGAASLVVCIDPTGRSGVAVGSADGLARTLGGVVPELAPIALDAGFLGPQAADWLAAVAKSSPAAKLNLHLDPLSAFAEAGSSPGPIESHVFSAANVASRLAQAYPEAGLFLASGRVVHEAGGGDVAELAFAAASALAYAKALVRSGLTMDEAFARIALGLSVDADHFAGLAKLRAARLLWRRIVTACGIDIPAHIEARSSRRMLTARDPWTNMLRLTAAGFAAAVGGADAVVLGAFTDALGHPTAFARRQSRNTQLILMEEAHLGRVADPAAGSGYIEDLTGRLVQAAWTVFQAIETAGGVIAALEKGLITAEVERALVARDAEPRIVGVTVFPPTQDTPVELEPTTPVPVDAPSPRLPGPDSHCPALVPIRLSAPFEAVA